MSISLGVPTIESQAVDTLALNVAALTGASGVQISNANSYPASAASSTARNAEAAASSGASANATVAAGLDPLTPSGVTASGAAALTRVITTVTTTLNEIQSSTLAGLTQLVTSSGFQLLLQVLGSAGGPGDSSTASEVPSINSTGSQASAAQLAALLTAPEPTAAVSQSPTNLASATVPPIPGKVVIEQTSNSVNPAPYFQQLLGELETTYKTASAPAPAANTAGSNAPVRTEAQNEAHSSGQSSELDLFLKWLSVNGASSVVTSA
jgi:hypothetical protein